jgi:hypothetical protein
VGLLGKIFGAAPKSGDPATELIERYLKEEGNADTDQWKDPQARGSACGEEILAHVRETQADVVAALIVKLADLDHQADTFRQSVPNEGIRRMNVAREPGWFKIWNPRRALYHLLDALLSSKLPLSGGTIAELCLWCVRSDHVSTYHYPVSKIVAAANNLSAKGPLEPNAVEALTALRKKLADHPENKDLRKPREQIEKLLGCAPSVPIEEGEVWAEAARADISRLSPTKQVAWAEVLSLCQSATSASPSAKWLASAEKLITKVMKKEDFKQTVLAWFPLVDKPRPTELLNSYNRPLHPLHISDAHADILRGLAWICGLFEDKEMARAVGALAVSAYKKIPGQGPRLVRVGNACVHALGAMPGVDGVGQMALLRVKVKFGTAQKMLEKALGVAAQRLGLPKEDLEEMAVPGYGLTEVGKATWEFGDFSAELVISSSKTTEIIWRNAEGKIQKSVPAKVKSDFAEDLKELKAAEKDIQKMLPAQAERIDQLYLQQKEWPLEVWRERYLDHPLVGVIARKLIWRFSHDGKSRDGLWQNGAISDRHGHPLELAAGTTVKLWHPLDTTTPDIEAWRLWLEEQEIRQPFKQAHREVYILTPAEENTRVYSNRFAAHILRQHQFHALAAARGWKNKLRLMVDDTYPPANILLPKWKLRAEFWIEGIGTEYGQDTNDSGSYLYLATDQVRFYSIEAAQRYAHAGGGGYAPDRGATDEPVPLAEIPALVFSEIMRDVDLFVGVASVGNDPNWNDGGPRGRYVDYWQNYSFGELNASAQTRKTLLERLVPRLKIADKCSFADKFLVVKGQLHTYKVHLGSGNILMSPNDQYLCIVPKGAATPAAEKVFLPFEGDRVLALILSKAFLLAEDAKIKDETINRQIRPKV